MSADGDTVRAGLPTVHPDNENCPCSDCSSKRERFAALSRLEARVDALTAALEEIRDHGDETPCDEECGPYLVSVAAAALAEAAPEATP